ncbi:MAG: hypothetical protein FWF60_07775, partial [Oscillospiraceae bacterium]|nr:hypothetical protein [Oscillospiraceae bacterium]
EGFIRRSRSIPERKLLHSIPRISRWSPPEGCDMWYSMPAMIAAALCGAEANETGRAGPAALPELNARFREVMHLTGTAYSFLWDETPHLIEELWRANDYAEAVARVMGYYGRDYVFLTEKTATPAQARRLITWSVANGRPVVTENLAGLPEFSLVMGYENGGDTLMGWTYCEECAVQKSEAGMFVNPARWGEQEAWCVLAVGEKTEPIYNDRDSVGHALAVLDREQAAVPFYDEAMCAGDAALRQWLSACDSPEHAAALFTVCDIWTYALYQNSIYTQQCMLAWYKALCVRSSQKVHDAVNQITIAVDRLEGSRKEIDKLGKKKPTETYAAACRAHIEFILQYRRDLRGWLRMIVEALPATA